jgi:hypothetical protein
MQFGLPRAFLKEFYTVRGLFVNFQGGFSVNLFKQKGLCVKRLYFNHFWVLRLALGLQD